MSQLVAQLVSAAVVGALSPVATMATIAVLAGRRRPLANAVVMLAGWSTLLLVLAAVVLGLIGGTNTANTSAKAMFNLVVGILLISFGLRNLVGGRHPLAAAASGDPQPPSGMPRWMRTLDNLSLAKAFGFGAMLLALSPADLAVYLSAEHGTSDQSVAARLLLTLLLILAIDLCMLIPIGIYVAMPTRAGEILARGRNWLIAHQRRLMAWVLLAFGVLLIITAVIHLA